ncbi:MAG: hypothetical protein AB1467_07185 [Candidatus Diapherotrites archaeon]
MEKVIIIVIGLLFSIRGGKIYLRTGLKGELIRAIGIILIMISYHVDDIILGIIGFVIFNVGWLILVTFEGEICKEIYGNVRIYDRIIGNFPQLLDEREVRAASKTIGIVSGVLCFISAFEFYKRLESSDIIDIVNIVILIMAGILFVTYFILKK